MTAFILIFVGTLVSAGCGVFLTLWCAHVARTGCSPLPKMPSVRLFKRKAADDDDDDDETPTNGQARSQPRVGP